MFAPPLPTAGIGYQHHQFPLGIASHDSPSSPFQESHSPALAAPEPSFQDDLLRSASPLAGMQRSPSRAGPSPHDLAEDGRATPMNAVTKHPKLRLQLSLGADAFEAGANVYGRMELSALTGRGMRIGEIAVEMEAAEELHSRDHSARQTFLYARTLFQGAHLPPSNAVVPQSPITTASHTHSGSTVWWTARKGKTTFPFSFPIPIRAPSAVQFAGNASLRYVLKGTAQIWIAPTNPNAPSASPHDHQNQQRHLITVRAEVPVVERWPTMLVKSISTHPLFHESIESVADTRVFLGGNGAVWLEAYLSRSLFLSGSEIHLRVSVRNNTKRHVSGVKVSLARRLVFPVIRSDERDPGGPGSLLRPPAKTLALQGGAAGQQPMITEVVSEQNFKSAGSTSSQSGVSYEFPPSEETSCVLPVRVPYDLRSVGLGVPCGPDHGGEELAQQQAAGQLHDPRLPPGSGWSGRSLLFEVHVLLRVALPLGALAKDLVVELPIWVVHPRSVGAEGVKLLMEAKDMALQNPRHQHPGVPSAAESLARQGTRHSLGSHEQAYQNMAPQRPHSSAGQRQLPTPGQAFLPHLIPQVTPYGMPMSPSPHSLAPLQQYAIERGWSPAPVHPGPDPLALPSIAAVVPARPSTAMDSFRPPVMGIVPPAPQPVPPGMMVAIPQSSVPATYAYGNDEQGDSPGFVFDPTATDWRASRMLVGPSQLANQHGHAIQRSMSAAPDVGGSASGSQILQQVTTFANMPTSRSAQPSPSVSPAPSIRHVGETSSTRGSLLRNTVRSVSGPLPLPSSTLSVTVQTPQSNGNDAPIEVPRPSPSPGPSDEPNWTRQSTTPAKYHQHTPTPPASMLSDSRPSPTSAGPVLGAKVIAAPAAQRAAAPPQDVYAQLALHSHSRILSEVAEEADDYEEDEGDEVQGHSRQPSEKPRGSVLRSAAPSSSKGAATTAAGTPGTSNPVPTRSLTAKDVAALEKMADQSMSGSESSLRSVRVEKARAGGEAVSARGIFDQPKASSSRTSAAEPDLPRHSSGRVSSVKDKAAATIVSSSAPRRSGGSDVDTGGSASGSRVGRSPSGLDDLEKRLAKRASVESLTAARPPPIPAASKPIQTFANVAPERGEPASTSPARFLGAADFEASRSAIEDAPQSMSKPSVAKEQLPTPAVSLHSIRRQSLDVGARPSWLDDHELKHQSTKRTDGSLSSEPKRSRHSIDVARSSTGSALAAALASPSLTGSSRAHSLSTSPAAKTKNDNSWIRDRMKPSDRASALALEKKPTIDQILSASKTDVARQVSDGTSGGVTAVHAPAPAKPLVDLIRTDPVKIKPVKKPTPAAVYLNAASPQGVFAKEVISAPLPVPDPEVVAPTPKIHPYSALALRPTRRQSMDFKGRAAAFEGKLALSTAASESLTGDEDSRSGLRSRSRHSIDVARPSICPQASASAGSPPLPSSSSAAASESTRTESVASLPRSSTAKALDDEAWIQRFSKVSSKPAASSPQLLKPTASVPKPKPRPVPSAEEKMTIEDHLQVPKLKDLSTVDGRGTTKAIGSNRLRELRSVWGS